MMNKETTTALDQIDVIIGDVQNLLDHKLDFNAFVTISLGIEYLGNFSDSEEFTDFGNSEIRFKNGFDHFKEKWYQNNKELLFKELRGPLIHQYRTGENLLLTSNCVQGAPLSDHRKVTDESLTILVVEQLFEDYKEACARFKNKIKKRDHSFAKKKIESNYSKIVEINSPTQNITYNSTGTTYGHETIASEGTGKPITRKERRKIEREKASNKA